MNVALIYFLVWFSAAKICTNETHLLGAQPVFMRKLLEIVRNKVETQCVDITIKFTLSALWNLTGNVAFLHYDAVKKTIKIDRS